LSTGIVQAAKQIDLVGEMVRKVRKHRKGQMY